VKIELFNKEIGTIYNSNELIAFINIHRCHILDLIIKKEGKWSTFVSNLVGLKG